MNTKPNQILECLAASMPDFEELNEAAEGLRAITGELAPILVRHRKAAEHLAARVKLCKDIDTPVAEVLECISAYPAKLRTLAYDAIHMAEVAETINGKFKQFGKAENE